MEEIETELKGGGIVNFFASCTVSTLRKLCQSLGIDSLYRKDDAPTEFTQRLNHIADEIMLGGMELALLTITNPMLSSVAKELGIKCKDDASLFLCVCYSSFVSH